MKIKRILKGSLISLAILGMIGGSINSNVSAKRHHYRRSRKVKRTVYKYGYYRHHHFHYYKTGYYRNGKWIKRRTRRARVKPTKKSKSSKQAKYMWTMYGSKPSDYEKVQVIGHDKSSGEPHVQLVSKSKKLAKLNAGRRFYVPTYGLFRTKAAVIKDIKESNKSNTSNHHMNSRAWQQAVVKNELKLITKDRAEYGKSPLYTSSELSSLAQMRAKQTYQHHLEDTSDPHVNEKTGQPYDDQDAQQLGYNDIVGTMGENLAFGVEDSSAKETAKEDNNMLYTEEEPYDGGHYQNIIGEYNNSQGDEDYTSVGVGAYGDVLAENFTFKPVDQLNESNNNPSDSNSDNSDDSSSDDNDDSYTVNNNNNNGSSSTSYSDGSSNNNNNNSNGGSAVAVAGGGVGGSAIGGTVYSSNGTVIARGGSAAGGAAGGAAAA